MKLYDVLKNDYFRLFVKRESKVVLGRKFSTLWLLTAVLTVTFLAIAFSNASLNYLSFKMEDPFINWVDIKNSYKAGQDVPGLLYALNEDSNKQKYHFYNFQADHYIARMFYSASGEDSSYAKMRFFESMNTPLVDAILSDDNVVNGWSIGGSSDIDQNSIGVIITHEFMLELGYVDAPSYIYFQAGGCEGADEYGFDVDNQGFSKMPFPVLAVVKRLPGNVDIIASSYLYKQTETNEKPFNLCQSIYAEDLRYFVPSSISMDDFKNSVKRIAKKHTDAKLFVDDLSFYMPQIDTFKDGDLVCITSDYEELDYATWRSINLDILNMYAKNDVHRVYEYTFGDTNLPTASYISIHFKDLDMLEEFEQYVSSEYNVDIEMSQVNAKRNFNVVSAMGNILSWAIIVFAIIAIILFVVNLLQSYFQKVKRNLGTFKAFGISNGDLISVYVLIMAAIILTAVVLSVSITWIIQGGLHICGILKDGTFDYLSLWSVKTVCSIAVIVVVSIYTVGAVMHKLLKATPGDLIYDRQ